MYSIFSEALRICKKNIQISSVHTLRFLLSVKGLKKSVVFEVITRVEIKTVVFWVMTP